MLTLETVKKRISCRTYSPLPLGKEELDQIMEFARSHDTGPFGHRVDCMLLHKDTADRDEIGSIATYGVIRNAPHYLAGRVKIGEGASEDFGFVLEMVILRATGMGIGTCWLGGTFRRSRIAARLGLKDDEIIPAVTPLGYPADKRSLIDSLFRLGAGSDRRRAWREIFFKGDFSTAVSPDDAGSLAPALEAVRLAPSASNRQPWRVCLDAGKKDVHFFLKRTPGYDTLNNPVRLQEVDMGIAMCHFDIVTQQLGIEGAWLRTPPPLVAGKLEYIASWILKR